MATYSLGYLVGSLARGSVNRADEYPRAAMVEFDAFIEGVLTVLPRGS